MTKEQRKDLAIWVKNNPEVTYTMISILTGYSFGSIARLAAEHEIHRPSGPKTSNREAR